MTDIVKRLFEVDVYGEFADCPAAAQEFMQALQVKLKEARSDALEEAAKVADEMYGGTYPVARRIAAAIRALKEKK